MKKVLKKVISAFLVAMVTVTSILPKSVSAKELPKDDNGKTAKELVYGQDTSTEYVLGTAAYFALFGENVTIAPLADCVGRVAAEEFVMMSKNSQTGEKFLGNYGFSCEMPSGISNTGAASVICNNTVSKLFGNNINPDYDGHNSVFVVAEGTEIIGGNNDDERKKIIDRTYVVTKNSLINFSEEMELLTEVSESFTSLVNGTPEKKNSGYEIVLKGTDSKLNCFSLDASDFISGLYSFTIDIPDDSYAVINISGSSFTFTPNLSWSFKDKNGKQISQDDPINRNILLNFYEATEISLLGPSRGCILAPKATITDDGTNSHNAGQIIAKSMTICHEQGAFGFTMPKSFLPKSAYTAHYVYYDVDGELNEIPADLYDIFIGRKSAPDAAIDNISVAYQPDDKLQAVEAGSNEITSARSVFSDTDGMEVYDTLYGLGFPIKFAVYEDGAAWNKAKTGNDLLNPDTYSAMTRKSDIDWTASYTFTKSNVYFVMYPMGKVTIDVSWDDKLDKSDRRPDEFYVSLVENVPNAGNTTKTVKEKNEQELLVNNSTIYYDADAEVGKDVVYEKYFDTFEYYVPLFGKQPDSKGQDSDYVYGTTVDKFGLNGLFDINYSVPEYYEDVTVTRVDKNGNEAITSNGIVAQFHIVLRGKYIAQFFIVDEYGNREEVYKTNFYNDTNDDYDSYRGYATTPKLPNLTSDEFDYCFGVNLSRTGYSVAWRDISTGKLYPLNNSKYSFDYEDVVFEATVTRTETLTDHPWLYTYIINYHGNNYIPGKVIPDRLEADGTTDPAKGGYTFIQKDDTTDYSYETLKAGEYDNTSFILMSFAFGVAKDMAAATKVTVATDGFGENGNIIYTAEKLAKSADYGCMDSFRPMSFMKPLTVKDMIPDDHYIDEYDGMRCFSLALPADAFDAKNLYFTVYYYDENGRESVWFSYAVNMEKNNMWTISKEYTDGYDPDGTNSGNTSQSSLSD